MIMQMLVELEFRIGMNGFYPSQLTTPFIYTLTLFSFHMSSRYRLCSFNYIPMSNSNGDIIL